MCFHRSADIKRSHKETHRTVNEGKSYNRICFWIKVKKHKLVMIIYLYTNVYFRVVAGYGECNLINGSSGEPYGLSKQMITCLPEGLGSNPGSHLIHILTNNYRGNSIIDKTAYKVSVNDLPYLYLTHPGKVSH